MYCQKCGAPLNKTDKFCSSCGMSLSEKRERKKTSAPLVAVLCLVFCLLGVGGSWLFMEFVMPGEEPPAYSGEPQMSQNPQAGGNPVQNQTPNPVQGQTSNLAEAQTEGGAALASRTWDDPDALVTAYLQALQAVDVDGVLALCDIPEQLEYMNWTGYVERYKAIVQNMYVPNNDQATKAIAEKKLENDITSKLFPIYASVFAGRSPVAEAISSMQLSVYEPDSGGAEAFARLFTEQNLAQISYAAAEIPLERSQDRVWQSLFQNIHALYGDVVTDYREYGVVLSYDGSYSAHGLTLYQYGDAWKIHSLNAPMSLMNSSPEYVSAVEGMSMDQVEALAVQEYGISPERILYP